MRKTAAFFMIVAFMVMAIFGGCAHKRNSHPMFQMTVLPQPSAEECEFSIGGMTTLRDGAVVVETCEKKDRHFVEVNAAHGTANWHLISIGPNGDVFDLQKVRRHDVWDHTQYRVLTI